MTEKNDFGQRAAETLRLAQQARDPEQSVLLLEMAETFRTLAHQAQRLQAFANSSGSGSGS